MMMTRPFQSARRTRLHVEALEDRVVPALGNPLQTFIDPGTGATDFFGESLATSGDNLLIGAAGSNGGRGAAYLYSTSGGAPVQTFTDPGGVVTDAFGSALAISGTDVLIGAYGVGGHGAAYLYNTSGTLLQTFSDPGGATRDYFGESVALSGNNVLVGAYGTNSARGAAYLFSPAGGPPLQTYTPPAGGSSTADFGGSVAVAGATVLIGAIGQGAAYPYSTTGGPPLQTFTAPGSALAFGNAVALSGTNVLIGAINSGTVYLYSTTGGPPLQSFAAPNNAAVGFGYSVVLSGADVLIGAAPADSQRGAAFLYNVAGALLQTFTDPGGAANDFFGQSVAVSGSDVLIGAEGTNSDKGAAYLYGTATATTALYGNNQATTAGTPFGTLPEVQVFDADGNPVSGANVTFAEADGPGGAGASFAGGRTATATTNADGIAYAPVLTANGTAGPFTVTAVNGTLTSTFQLTNLPGPAAKLAVANAPTSVTAGAGFALQVDVLDAFGNRVSGDGSEVTVTPSGPGPFTAGATTVQAIGGVASFYGMAIQKSGSYTLTFSDGSLTGTSTALTASAAAPALVTASGGTPQSATVGHAFGTALAATVTDAFGNPVPGAAVTFTAPASGASGSFSGGATATTNAAGLATANAFTANPIAGGYGVTATASGGSNPQAGFALTNLAGPAAVIVATSGAGQSTLVSTTFPAALVATETDAGGNPVAGVTVTFSAPSSGAAATFVGGPTAVSNAAGQASKQLTANGTAGTYSVSAATTGFGTAAPFTGLTNVPVISFAPAAPAAPRVGGAYSQALTGQGGTAPYSNFVVVAGSLPAGISLSPAGTLGGTPTQGGTFAFTVRAQDSTAGPAAPYTGSQSFAMTVTAPAIAISPASLPAAQVGITYSQAVTATGGTAPYAYAVAAGALPPGLTLSGSGTVSGTPTVGGNYSFTITATDSSTGAGPYQASQGYALAVGPGGVTYNMATQTLTIAAISFGYSQATTEDAAGLHTTFTFTVNGTPLSLPDTAITHLVVTGPGNASASLVTNDTYAGTDAKTRETAEQVIFGAGAGQLYRGGVLFAQLAGFSTIAAAMGPADYGTILGTSGVQNTFVSSGSYAYMDSGTAIYSISGAQYVYGRAANAFDTAYHYDGSGASFVQFSGTAYSFMLGTDRGKSFFNEAVNFQANYAIARHAGQDSASFYDSPLNDVLVANTTTTYLYSLDASGNALEYDAAQGFSLVYAYSFVGGTDSAYVYDQAVNHVSGFHRIV
jgi:hypothetical protein